MLCLCHQDQVWHSFNQECHYDKMLFNEWLADESVMTVNFWPPFLLVIGLESSFSKFLCKTTWQYLQKIESRWFCCRIFEKNHRRTTNIILLVLLEICLLSRPKCIKVWVNRCWQNTFNSLVYRDENFCLCNYLLGNEGCHFFQLETSTLQDAHPCFTTSLNPKFWQELSLKGSL